MVITTIHFKTIFVHYIFFVNIIQLKKQYGFGQNFKLANILWIKYLRDENIYGTKIFYWTKLVFLTKKNGRNLLEALEQL